MDIVLLPMLLFESRMESRVINNIGFTGNNSVVGHLTYSHDFLLLVLLPQPIIVSRFLGL